MFGFFLKDKLQMQKMEATAFIFVSLWTSAVFTPVPGCPELCTCSNKLSRYFVDCSLKKLSHVPHGFPPNITTISLSANKISFLTVGSFDKATGLMSLWLARNEVAYIERGTLAPLVHLRNLDISYNKIVNFPWEDLQNLTLLYLLKINHNELSILPRDAFANLKDLRSLRLNNNNFVNLAEGTFDSLVSLSHLQIHNNPFACTCSMEWFKEWISQSTISIPDKKHITCATPEKLNGQPMENLAKSKCTSPKVTIRPEKNIHNRNLYEDTELVLTCVVKGHPKPEVSWSIKSKRTKLELPFQFTENDSGEFTEGPVTIFNDGTLLISNLRKEDSGKYNCFAKNELGSAEDFVTVKVVAVPQLMEETEIPTYPQKNPSIRHTTKKIPALDSLQPSKPEWKDSLTTVFNTLTEDVSTSQEKTKKTASISSKCGLTASTRYVSVSDHNLNGSLDDIGLYTFDFGVIALEVSETEARVRVNPRLIPRSTSSNQELEDDRDEQEDLPDDSEEIQSGGLYLCAAADQKNSAVQWSRIKDGINTYLFSGLRPATNYSLCLTYREEDCEVQVMFTTRRRVTNLLIIVSVSICLLTVSTVPLLGATCFHLVYKYRSKTYRLILKAKDQYHVKRNLTANFHITHTKHQRRSKVSQLNEERDGDSESGNEEVDTEESVVTESLSLSHCRVNLEP